MSDADLGRFLLQLPEYLQERAIISSLNIMLSTGEFETANQLVDGLLRNDSGKIFKAEIASIGVIVAVRAKNYCLARERYDFIRSLGKTDEILNYMADALFHLSDLLLPDEPSKLAKLWHNAISDNFPFHAQTIFAQLGLMLCRQFYKNRDDRQANIVAASMENCLSRSFCADYFLKLNDLKKENQ